MKYNIFMYRYKPKKDLHAYIKLNSPINKVSLNLIYKIYLYKIYLYKYNINLYKPASLKNKILLLNFKRNKFFPSILSSKGISYITLSLGMFSKFFLKPKPFKVNKQVYLLLISFLRKVLIYTFIKNISLNIKKVPKYFNELIGHIVQPSVNFYTHPFSKETVDEKVKKTYFTWTNVLFLNSRPYGKIKFKKKGRLKRKISKKITLLNSISD